MKELGSGIALISSDDPWVALDVPWILIARQGWKPVTSRNPVAPLHTHAERESDRPHELRLLFLHSPLPPPTFRSLLPCLENGPEDLISDASTSLRRTYPFHQSGNEFFRNFSTRTLNGPCVEGRMFYEGSWGGGEEERRVPRLPSRPEMKARPGAAGRSRAPPELGGTMVR